MHTCYINYLSTFLLLQTLSFGDSESVFARLVYFGAKSVVRDHLCISSQGSAVVKAGLGPTTV